MKQHGLGPKDRISLKREMDAVFERGRKAATRDLVVWSLQRPAGDRPRLAVVVSRKLGGAVVRNRLKRLVREAFRLNKDRLRKGVDVVVYPRPGCAWKGFEEARRALIGAWERARILDEKAAD